MNIDLIDLNLNLIFLIDETSLHWRAFCSNWTIINATEFSDESPKPRIVEEPASQLSIKGDNVTLKCKATSTADAPFYFTWKHDNLEIRDRTLHSDDEPTFVDGVTVASSELHLNNVTNAHAGRYQCMVTNNYGTSYSTKAKISVLGKSE